MELGCECEFRLALELEFCLSSTCSFSLNVVGLNSVLIRFGVCVWFGSELELSLIFDSHQVFEFSLSLSWSSRLS